MSHGGMECPECGGIRAMATNSNLDVEGNRIRSRLCGDCGHRFATVEVVLPGLNFHRTRPSKSTWARRTPQHVRIVPTGKSIRVELVESRSTNTCRRGHALVGDNVYIQASKGNRSCVTCRNAGARERYHNARRKAPPSIIEDQRRYWREQYRKKRAA